MLLLKQSSVADLLYITSIALTTPVDTAGPSQSAALKAPDSDVPDKNSGTFTTPLILTSITDRCAILQTGFADIAAVTGIANNLATIIKNKSNEHKCDEISGNIDHLNYQHHATGRKCDRTAQEKIIEDALQRAMDYMNTHSMKAACFQLTHGGTWKGLLQLAAQDAQIIQNKFDGITNWFNLWLHLVVKAGHLNWNL